MCLRLLELFAIGLQVDPSKGGSKWFSSRHSRELGPSGCTLRYLYYPSIPEDADYHPEVDIRAGAHSDYGSITLLFQRPGQPGLEIFTSEGTWAPVPVSPPGTESDPSPPILVNIGDLFSYWTNGLLRSTVHRVIFPKDARRGGEDRYSIAFFCHPLNAVPLERVPSELVQARAENGQSNGDVSEGHVMTAEEHLHERLKATYLTLKWDEKQEK
jgi:isopenicillin N synthase-like dioxygenase